MLGTALARAHRIQRAIGGNAVKPCAETGPLIEFAELFEGAQEAFLHYVLGVLLISSHTKSYPEQSAAMAFHQHPKRVRISGTRSGDKRCVRHFHPAVS
jgi:hypothetical protein